ncbi:MAG: diguanylate cyclase, partial [Candidatus Sulfobium sp.]
KILRYRAGLVKGGMPCFYRAVERIGYFSNIDRITGLLNKKALLSNLECELTISRKQQTDLSVLLIDIDHFKRINNLHGRDAGDRVLNHMSQVIRDTIRKTDIAGRYESDKFLLILQETTFAGAVKLAGKISSIVSNMEIRTEGNRSVRLSLSYGAGTADSLTDTAGKLIDSAEESLGVGNEINVGRVRKSESLPYSEMLTKHHSARPAE